MNSFTISQMQRYSGISVHSIRAWEKRYKALDPERSEGNTRNYNGKQLRRLLNIASLINLNYKISELCSFSDEKLHELLNKEMALDTYGDSLLISQLVAAGMEFNEILFDKIFSTAVHKYGIEDVYLKVIYPTLVRMGFMWSVDKIASAHEHFMSHLLMRKLNASIEQLPLPKKTNEHWLLFLPENEFHECGLLMTHFLLRSYGKYSTYLGANLPFETLKNTTEILQPSTLIFFLVAMKDEENDIRFLEQLHENFPNQKMYIAADANRISKFKNYDNIGFLKSLHDLKMILQNTK